jgi:hypothetical protein
VEACKATITLVDSVLLPFDPAAPPAANELAASGVVGGGACTVSPNSIIKGNVVKAGDANPQASRSAAQRSAAATGAAQRRAVRLSARLAGSRPCRVGEG